MSKKVCYFQCKSEGYLFSFPPKSYGNYEKYCKWKNILRKEDQEKLVHNFKLCGKHFEKCYFTINNRLTRHAVPTLILGITKEQEKLLSTFIENNENIIMKYNFSEEMEDKIKDNWRAIAPKLNALGPEKSDDAWAEYLNEVVHDLKKKKVIWTNESYASDSVLLIKNAADFTELEQKILQLWKKEANAQESPDPHISEIEEYEIVMEDEDGDNSRDSKTSRVSDISRVSGTSRVNWTCRNNDSANEVVRFTLNVATGGHKPLLQAADVAPYESPQEHLNIKCKCNETPDEFDAFGKDIAQQLRRMPIQTALDTKKLLMSVLRSRQSNILNNSFLP